MAEVAISCRTNCRGNVIKAVRMLYDPGPQPAARQSWAELGLVFASEIAVLDQSVMLSTAN